MISYEGPKRSQKNKQNTSTEKKINNTRQNRRWQIVSIIIFMCGGKPQYIPTTSSNTTQKHKEANYISNNKHTENT